MKRHPERRVPQIPQPSYRTYLNDFLFGMAHVLDLGGTLSNLPETRIHRYRGSKNVYLEINGKFFKINRLKRKNKS